ncbi:glomulin [Teleopsis dalmanni]|uniref:glomulin n=1 Tax=Teleopsis dalmanni TaxID=139649 RepID=UPI0018CEAE2C|nr:glomulin [Teleopsis dalmanni]
MTENNLHQVQNAQKPAQNLLYLIKKLIQEEQYEGLRLLFTSETEAQRNIEYIEEISSEVYHDICLANLNDSNYNNNLPLYICAEEILKILVTYATVDELILELLDVIEEQSSDNVFTTALRALQIALLRLGEKKPRVLQWSYNSVLVHLNKLPLPTYLSTGYDKEECALLEQNAQIEKLLMSYVTIGLFYDELVRDATTTLQLTKTGFRDCGINRRNVMCCFLLKLLDKPLALLDLSADENKTNTYTMQVATSLTNAITACIVDPFYFFRFLEIREVLKSNDVNCENIFIMEETLPSVALGIYYYMLLVRKVGTEHVPKVYTPLYVFKSLLILATILAYEDEPALQFQSLLLNKYALQQLQNIEIPFDVLQLNDFQKMMERLCEFCASCPHKDIRHLGPVVLNHYILQLDEKAQMALMHHLLEKVGYDSLKGFIIMKFKDACDVKLFNTNDVRIEFVNQFLNNIVAKKLCVLHHGVQSDLLNMSEVLISTLNVLIYFASHNLVQHTEFINLYPQIETNFVEPLRDAVNLSEAHYKARIDQCEKGLDAKDDAKLLQQVQMMDIKITNDTVGTEDNEDSNVVFSKEKKLQVFNDNIQKLNIILHLLSTLGMFMEVTMKKKIVPYVK